MRKDNIKGNLLDLMLDFELDQLKEKAKIISTFYNELKDNGVDEGSLALFTMCEFYGDIPDDFIE